MRQPFIAAGIAVSLCTTLALAAGGGGAREANDVDPYVDPVVKSARALIAKSDWLGAQDLLRKSLQSKPGNADYHNLLAFSTRKGPNPNMELVFAEYAEALRLDPKHKGAHEYLGEAYLQVNDLAKAKEQLAALDKICRFGCEEYSDLKKLIAQYQASHPQ